MVSQEQSRKKVLVYNFKFTVKADVSAVWHIGCVTLQSGIVFIFDFSSSYFPESPAHSQDVFPLNQLSESSKHLLLFL